MELQVFHTESSVGDGEAERDAMVGLLFPASMAGPELLKEGSIGPL